MDDKNLKNKYYSFLQLQKVLEFFDISSHQLLRRDPNNCNTLPRTNGDAMEMF